MGQAGDNVKNCGRPMRSILLNHHFRCLYNLLPGDASNHGRKRGTGQLFPRCCADYFQVLVRVSREAVERKKQYFRLYSTKNVLKNGEECGRTR